MSWKPSLDKMSISCQLLADFAFAIFRKSEKLKISFMFESRE